jgi:pre-mRNA-splicing factor ATP-dependent RNA helicase DHX15/PRP43
MQAAIHFKKNSYLTVKDNQTVTLHPSCCLYKSPKWVFYNEFVLTTTNFIRTVTTIELESLIEASTDFYALENFKENSETYREIKKILQKRLNKK